MDSTKRTARLAGLLYLLSSIPGAFALLYVPGKLVVEGNAAATADRLRASANLVRLGIGAELLSQAMFIFVALTLFFLFKPVAERSAVTMLVLILISIPISFFNVLNEVAGVTLANGGGAGNFLSAVDAPRRDALAYFFLDLHTQGISVAQIFWGLWLFPFGICVWRCGFIPRLLGILLMIAGCGHTISAFSDLALPQYAQAVARVTGKLTPGELPIIFWLLIWGARPQPVRAPAS